MQKVEGGRSCVGCIFHDEHFAGACEAGRREIFSEREEVVDGEVISRFCNMYRNENWGVWQEGLEDAQGAWEGMYDGDLALEDFMRSTEWFVEQARKEITTMFCFVVDVTVLGMTNAHCILRDLRNMEYDKSKYAVLISGMMGEHVEDLVHETNILKQAQIPCMLVLHSPNSTVEEKDSDTFAKAFGYQYVVTFSNPKTSAIEYDFLENLDNALNDDMEKVLYFVDRKRGLHVTSFNMINRIYPKYNDFDVLIERIIPDELEESGMYNEI